MHQDDNRRMTEAIQRDPDLSWVPDSSIFFDTIYQYYIGPKLTGPSRETEKTVVDLFVDKFKSGDPKRLLVTICKREARAMKSPPPQKSQLKSSKLDGLLKGLIE